jgi:hypothetical protein
MSVELVHQIPQQDWFLEAQGLNGNGVRFARSDGGWDKTAKELEALRDIKDNWDDAGAVPPASPVVQSAIGLANLLRARGMEPPARVVAGPDGCVILEWQGRDGSYCEVEVVGLFQAEVMLVEPGRPTRHWTLPDLP